MWDRNGTGNFNDFTCASNAAEGYGGCMYGVGIAVINDEAVLQGNLAESGGCICERARVMRSWGSSDVRVIGRGGVTPDTVCMCLYLSNCSVNYIG